MTAAKRLSLVKSNLQQTTQANDEYITHCIDEAAAYMQMEGARDDGSYEYDSILINYASYLFRKRSASAAGGREGETAMPRFVRLPLNGLVFKQALKAGENT